MVLEVISSDIEADVVRVTNRLRADYDAARTLGYRDVGLNLRLQTSETRRVGLDAHICEVQLVLADFARIKVSYVALACGNHIDVARLIIIMLFKKHGGKFIYMICISLFS